MKRLLYIFLVGLALGLIGGFFISKCSRPQLDEKVKRDTIWITDTVPDLNPQPKDSVQTKTVIKWLPKWLPAKPDTVTSIEWLTMHDTVAVEVPITSKHYGGKNYDAYVSGFEPKLDSIFVYNETQIITETITRYQPPNKWELDIVGGVDYNTAQQNYTPYAVGELMYKPNRLQVGIQGGVIKNGNKAEPIVGGKVKVRIF